MNRKKHYTPEEAREIVAGTVRNPFKLSVPLSEDFSFALESRRDQLRYQIEEIDALMVASERLSAVTPNALARARHIAEAVQNGTLTLINREGLPIATPDNNDGTPAKRKAWNSGLKTGPRKKHSARSNATTTSARSSTPQPAAAAPRKLSAAHIANIKRGKKRAARARKLNAEG